MTASSASAAAASAAATVAAAASTSIRSAVRRRHVTPIGVGGGNNNNSNNNSGNGRERERNHRNDRGTNPQWRASLSQIHDEVKRSSSPKSVLSIPSRSVLGGTGTVPNAGAAVRQVGTTRRIFLLRPYLTGTEIHGLAHRISKMCRNGSISSVLIGNNDDHHRIDDKDDNNKGKSNNKSNNGASSDNDDGLTLVMPSMMVDDDRMHHLSRVDIGQFGPGYGKVWHVSGGYDPMQLLDGTDKQERSNEASKTEQKHHVDAGVGVDASALDAVLDGVVALALACRGTGPSMGPAAATAAAAATAGAAPTDTWTSPTKVPVLTVPHGLVHDSGSAMLLSSYVLATYDTTFRIFNPTRGLSLDPTGLSYMLPRVGWEYDQPCASISSSVATIIGTCGYVADSYDMLELGLATHMLGEASKLGWLERTLSNLDSWDMQKLVVRTNNTLSMDERHEYINERYMEGPPDVVNAKFKNRAIANVVMSMTHYDAAGLSDGTYGGPSPSLDEQRLDSLDPSLYLHPTDVSTFETTPMFRDRHSRLVDLAFAFDSILAAATMEDVRNGLDHVAKSQESSSDPDERECAAAAKELVSSLTAQCPLSVKVVHRLLRLGSGRNETLERCMQRERKAQRNMYLRRSGIGGGGGIKRGLNDFELWAAAVKSGKIVDDGEGTFKGWTHSCLEDVTDDEVAEVLEAE